MTSDEQRSTGSSSSCDGERSPIDSDVDQRDGPAASDGDQTGSDGTRDRTGTPQSGPSSQPDDDRQPPDYAALLARAAAQRERDERNRAPGTWMPGPEDFDRDPDSGDDTEFGT